MPRMRTASNAPRRQTPRLRSACFVDPLCEHSQGSLPRAAPAHTTPAGMVRYGSDRTNRVVLLLAIIARRSASAGPRYSNQA
jgi:hypothetical protein